MILLSILYIILESPNIKGYIQMKDISFMKNNLKLLSSYWFLELKIKRYLTNNYSLIIFNIFNLFLFSKIKSIFYFSSKIN